VRTRATTLLDWDGPAAQGVFPRGIHVLTDCRSLPGDLVGMAAGCVAAIAIAWQADGSPTGTTEIEASLFVDDASVRGACPGEALVAHPLANRFFG